MTTITSSLFMTAKEAVSKYGEYILLSDSDTDGIDNISIGYTRVLEVDLLRKYTTLVNPSTIITTTSTNTNVTINNIPDEILLTQEIPMLKLVDDNCKWLYSEICRH